MLGPQGHYKCRERRDMLTQDGRGDKDKRWKVSSADRCIRGPASYSKSGCFQAKVGGTPQWPTVKVRGPGRSCWSRPVSLNAHLPWCDSRLHRPSGGWRLRICSGPPAAQSSGFSTHRQDGASSLTSGKEKGGLTVVGPGDLPNTQASALPGCHPSLSSCSRCWPPLGLHSPGLLRSLGHPATQSQLHSQRKIFKAGGRGEGARAHEAWAD